jgi:hypothetical protein
VDRLSEQCNNTESDHVWTTYFINVHYRLELDANQDVVVERAMGVDRSIYDHANVVDLQYLPDEFRSAVLASHLQQPTEPDSIECCSTEHILIILLLLSIGVSLLAVSEQGWTLTIADMVAICLQSIVLTSLLRHSGHASVYDGASIRAQWYQHEDPYMNHKTVRFHQKDPMTSMRTTTC